MQSKTVVKTSRFPASRKNIFNKLKSIKMLQYIASPYMTFTPLTESNDLKWKAGRTFYFRLKLFGVIPLGIHTIKVTDFNEDAYRIKTIESNAHVPVWNHRIVLNSLNDGASEYTDEVELFAGWKTPFVYLWANAFYAHRQKKWLKFLSKDGVL